MPAREVNENVTSPGEAPPPSRRCRWADFQLAEDRQTDSMAATGQGAVEKGATKAAVKVLSDGLRMDLVDTPLRVTNVKPGLVETNFSITRFGGDKERADKVYQGIKPLTGDDIADVVYYAASAPAHVQIAEVLVLATHQASGSLVYRV